MKTTAKYLLLLAALATVATACENDDTDFRAYIDAANGDTDDDGDTAATTEQGDTIFIVYNGNSAVATGGATDECVAISGADVTVNALDVVGSMTLVLSGTTTNGSLLVYRSTKYEIVLAGVSLTNPQGPAINNQCSKSLYVTALPGTVNTLADGTAYADATIDQKGALFSEGQIYFRGSGSLTVTGNCKNAIASDDYITVEDDANLTVLASTTGSNGLKANDGVFIEGGSLTIDVRADGARGIRSEARTEIRGGAIAITTSGDCLYDSEAGDYSGNSHHGQYWRRRQGHQLRRGRSLHWRHVAGYHYGRQRQWQAESREEPYGHRGQWRLVYRHNAKELGLRQR